MSIYLGSQAVSLYVGGQAPIKGVPVTLDGAVIDYPLDLLSEILYTDKTKSTLPYDLYEGSAVVYNNEIHILGGYGNTKNHYKYDGTSWTSVGTLPYDFYNGSAVVYNNEIHIFGSKYFISVSGGGNVNPYETYHYKYNGSSWSKVSTLPYGFYYGSVVIYNDEIHILGGGNSKTSHYKYDGSSWTSVSTLPYEFSAGSAVVYNNEIHLLGGTDTDHYKYDGTSWTSVSTLPYSFCYGTAFVYDNEIHILGGTYGKTSHYKYRNNSWTSVSTLPHNFYENNAVIYNNEINILGSRDSSYYAAHYLISRLIYQKA